MLTICFLFAACITQDSPTPIVPFDSDRWSYVANESRIGRHLGKDALYLHGGRAQLDEREFTDGIIEFEMSFGPARGFSGAAWRVQDGKNYEDFYLRPHQSGNPDSCQYTPVFHGVSAWQLYYGDGYGASLNHKFAQWMHIKLVIAGDRAEVFVDDMSRPALVMHELKREIEAGGLALVASSYAPAWFADFRYTKLEDPALVSARRAPMRSAPGTILSWSISPALAVASIGEDMELDGSALPGGAWQDLPCETTGLANLARVQGLVGGRDSAFAKITINAAEATTKRLDFGASDRVRVYLNGLLLYSGNNDYSSRDYRYLGTIGFFDAVYLPLEEGENELLFLVSESFGGWGLQARFADPNGISWR